MNMKDVLSSGMQYIDFAMSCNLPVLDRPILLSFRIMVEKSRLQNVRYTVVQDL